ncbi:repeatdomain containing protein [Pyrenophora tritici-repentis]|uniref:DUF3723 containing protein n=2 Tax=Pyrenophora tritici-repentis TaxID=45151 RepID=A0A922N6M1_9PLEO|nr:DUF3723 domain containing protein [Pyrenophora tritici-repentis]KAI0580089.1 DUF3723 domain-containing protein [Pyrenophora tritici-repentis]KAI1510426.1 DUF3723 containing protein [Pyrenophora tritici-repentis]KAI1537953.1 repeatdomain containing protein [Pyrenophora tritici-repentis]KAI1570723.1 repeatdomain containing protein [Pyrenophora tritici-repentis]
MSLDDMCSLRWPQDAPALRPKNVHCLSGMHRIEAARRFLDENDKWWIVRLFSHNTPKPVLVRIIESYSNELRPSDGEIFRKIRLYHRENDQEALKRWWSCLEKSKPKDLRQLFRRPSLAAGFDALIDMPGLWAKLQLGALHRLLVLKCDEEMTLYLDHIAKAWKRILRCGDTILPPSAVDAITVQSLELLAPKHSDMDKSRVISLMEHGKIFPSQSDRGIRKILVENICNLPGVIPSLWTFFETLKYLEPLCEALRRLLGEQMKRTIRSSLTGLFFAPSKNMVQLNETEDVEIKVELSQQDAMMVAYTELWAFCSRHFDGLTACTPRKEIGGPKPYVKGPNPVAWQHLAKFAISRGFQIKHAQALVAKEELYHSQLALEYLRKANPMCSNFSSDHVQRVLTAVRSDESAKTCEPVLKLPHLSVDRRSGRPFEHDLTKEKEIMFFPQLYSGPPCEDTNLRLLRRDLFSCIFISLELQTADFGVPTTAPVSVQDVMDIDIPPEPPNPDAQRTELQLHYATLHQEYQSLSLQHETLVSKSNSQHKKIDNLESKNAEIQDLLEEYTSKYQQLNDAYCCFIKDHHGCEKVKGQLQDLIHRWKAQSEENMELESTCTRLRRELRNALDSRTLDEPVLRAEEVQAPLAIEATTVSDIEYSDDEPTSDSLTLYTRAAGSNDRNQYEIFLAYAATEEGEPHGYGFDISQSIEEAIPQIADSLRQAESVFGSEQYHAITFLGTHLTSTEPAYLFERLKADRTIFIGRNSVLAALIPALSTAAASSPQPHQAAVIFEQAATQALGEDSTRHGKRKRGDATREIANKRRCVPGTEVEPAIPSTRAKKRKPLGILKSKKARGREQTAAAISTSTAAGH